MAGKGANTPLAQSWVALWSGQSVRGAARAHRLRVGVEPIPAIDATVSAFNRIIR
jgi:hypothetical protein